MYACMCAYVHQCLHECMMLLMNSEPLILLVICNYVQWTLFAMISRSKNSGYSWGTLHGRLMEGWAFHYDIGMKKLQDIFE